MRRIFIVMLIILVVFAVSGYAKKVTTLTEIMKPVNIQADSTRLYVIEGASIFIYSLKDYQLLKKFGKEGEGPGEFVINPRLPNSLDVSTDDIIVNSMGKLSYFSKDGTFKREIKCTITSLLFQPMGDQLIGMGQVLDSEKLYNTVNFYDSNLKKIKEIYRADTGLKGPGKGIEALQKVFWFQYYDNKIFLPGEDDAAVDAFDKNMNKLFTLRVEVKKQKVTDEFKNEFVDYLKTSSRTKDIYELLLKPVRFPDSFPTIQFFFGADNILYVLTWIRENDKYQFHTFDMKGKFLKKLWIPLVFQSYLEPFPLTVNNGKLYQVIENMDEETWELHVSEIN
jgi:hypothetical protein